MTGRADPEMMEILSAGLLAQGFVETAPHDGWRRFAKFGRAGMEGEAYYVQPDGSLWHSAIRFTDPDVEVKGPILDQIFIAGCNAARRGEVEGISINIKSSASRRIDADAALDELMGGSE